MSMILNSISSNPPSNSLIPTIEKVAPYTSYIDPINPPITCPTTIPIGGGGVTNPTSASDAPIDVIIGGGDTYSTPLIINLSL